MSRTTICAYYLYHIRGSHQESLWTAAHILTSGTKAAPQKNNRKETMKEKVIRSSKESNILEIHHSDSIINAYYDMSAPLQLTFSYSSGLHEDDYYNIVSASPDKDYFYASRIVSDFHRFNDRPLHQHSFFELLIVLKGSIMQKLEDKEYLYPAGTCCLVNQNIFHIEKYIGEAQLLFIGLSVNFIRELLESHKTAYFQKEETACNNSIFQFMDANIQSGDGKNYLDFLPAYQNRKNIEELRKLSDALIHSMMFPRFGSTYIIKGVICELFQYLDTKQFYHISKVKLHSSSDQLLFSRIGHLMEETDGRMSRSDLESALCYSGNYMNTIVNKYTGMNLHDYGLTFKLKKAASLLADTDKSISAIETQLGFTNRTHFYKMFRKKYGVTPGEYRSQQISPA